MTGSISSFKRPRILIVDDDYGARTGLKRYFERQNYEVVAVSTFSGGRQALAEASPDCLIADVRLGEYNGLQLVATNPRAIPAIIVTGFADPVLEADARRLGADYMVKPVSPAALVALIKVKLEVASESVLPFLPGRRSTRKRVIGDLPASVDDCAVRIVDLSYGGVRLEVDAPVARRLPQSFALVLFGVSMLIDLVWTTSAGDPFCTCGGAIASGQHEITAAWQRVVDAYGEVVESPLPNPAASVQ